MGRSFSRCRLRSITMTARLAAGLAVCTGLAAVTLPVARTAAATASDEVSTELKQQTLARLMTRVTIEFDENRLEDVVTFIETITQAEIDPLWLDDRSGIGLDPDTPITLKARDVTALELIEMVLEQVDRETDAGDAEAATWQFTKYGTFEFGPRERLNKRRRIVFYDVNDLLMEVPNFDNAPEFDLNQIFQQGGQAGGGGGGQSPFQNNNQDDVDRRSLDERAQDLIDLITGLVETEQWFDNGGDSSTIRFYRGTLLVNAPDYVHRQLGGYPWWPGQAQRSRTTDGRRSVTMTDRGVDIDAYRQAGDVRRP